MAPTVLGIGIPATSPIVPEDRREGLQNQLDAMESNMQASQFEWEMFYFTPDMPFESLPDKLREKQWDVVMVGTGLRFLNELTPFFERIVNTVHTELPNTKFAFPVSIELIEQSVTRALALQNIA